MRMATTLTSKGQVTLPKAIRDFLKVRPGDAIDFLIESEGRVLVRPSNADVRDLKGLLKRAGRKPVSLEAMEEAIVGHHGRRP
jgi:antitoxin PrlF